MVNPVTVFVAGFQERVRAYSLFAGNNLMGPPLVAALQCISSEKINPTPRPQVPTISTGRSMFIEMKLPNMGCPLSGATTTQPTRIATRARPRPHSHKGLVGQGAKMPDAAPYSPPQKHPLITAGMPNGGVGASEQGGGISPAKYSKAHMVPGHLPPG